MIELTADFRNRCEKIAAEERRNLGLPGYAPLSGEALAASHGVKIITPNEVSTFSTEMCEVFLIQQKVWGCLMQGPDIDPMILIHPNQSPTRRQSTLMHELAHLLLGHASNDLTSVLTGGNPDKKQEEEARYLGGCLQIPKTGIQWASQVGLSFARTMSHFNASKDMVQYRCNMAHIHL
ncbi:MAG: ImmA/IrrE family metallo-endopeptidase [Fibrella sp.]|nr:ImmA/IrrE family metallo-endopeptidase [Armatimonadota bacterium]